MSQNTPQRWLHDVTNCGSADSGRPQRWTTASGLQHHPSSEYLFAELTAVARNEGPNNSQWSGLTVYRFTRPANPRWDEIKSLSLFVVAQGRTASATIGERRVNDRLTYAVLGDGLDFDCRIVNASVHHPCLCVVLAIDPKLVRAVAASTPVRGRSPAEAVDGGLRSALSELDGELTESIVRFLQSLSAPSDRRVLAPLYLREMVYRLMQREQSTRLAHHAARQVRANPVAAALDYIGAHLTEPLTVDVLAAQANLSPSAFSRTFRERTGQSPYQYVKEARLDRARELFDDGRIGVAEVSRAVGYTSVSHFIKEFRVRIGATPGEYLSGPYASAPRAVGDGFGELPNPLSASQLTAPPVAPAVVGAR